MRRLERVAAAVSIKEGRRQHRPRPQTTAPAAASASGGKGAPDVARSIEATIDPDGDEWKVHWAVPFGVSFSEERGWRPFLLRSCNGQGEKICTFTLVAEPYWVKPQ